MENLKYRVYNYLNENRFYEWNGVKYHHLATIEMDNRKFVVYEALGERYIEELAQSNVSDSQLTPDQLLYIEDDELWFKLFLIASSEGLFDKIK